MALVYWVFYKIKFMKKCCHDENIDISVAEEGRKAIK